MISSFSRNIRTNVLRFLCVAHVFEAALELILQQHFVCYCITWGRLDLAVPFTPFTPNRQNSNQVVLEHLYRRTPATPSSKVV